MFIYVSETRMMVSDGVEMGRRRAEMVKSGHAKCAGVSIVLDLYKAYHSRRQSRCIFHRSRISDCYKKFVYSL